MVWPLPLSVSLRIAEVNMRPSLQRQISLPVKSFTTKSCVCPSGNCSSSIFDVLLRTFRVKRSFSASFFGLVMSKVVTSGAPFSALWRFAEAVGFSAWEKGAAANATDAAHSNGRMRRLSITSVTGRNVAGGAGRSHIMRSPTYRQEDERSTAKSHTNFASLMKLQAPKIFGLCSEPRRLFACENLHKRLISSLNGRREADRIGLQRRPLRRRFRRRRNPVRVGHHRLSLRRSMAR